MSKYFSFIILNLVATVFCIENYIITMKCVVSMMEDIVDWTLKNVIKLSLYIFGFQGWAMPNAVGFPVFWQILKLPFSTFDMADPQKPKLYIELHLKKPKGKKILISEFQISAVLWTFILLNGAQCACIIQISSC